MVEKKTEEAPKASEGKEPTYGELLVAPVSETLFILLPLIVIAIVHSSKGENVQDILASPEWSFGAAVLFGQSITKLIAGTLRGRAANWEIVSLLAAIVIVFGLVPSLTVLSLLLTTHEPSSILIASQVVLFIAGIASFLFFGSVGHYGLFHRGHGGGSDSE